MESDKLITALELQAGTAAAPLYSTYVLVTKLVCPPLPARPLVRRALQQRLAEWHQYRLIRVEAPAGYGKTVLGGQLVQQVMAGDATARVAWLSLDENDDEPTRFLIALAAALSTVIPATAEKVTSVALSQRPWLQPLHLLLGGLAESPARTVVVLDDVQRLQHPEVHRLLFSALERSSGQICWVLLSRQMLPFAVSKWRLQGHLLEVNSADLQLKHSELAEYLALTSDLVLEEETLSLLEERTQGWLAGIQLALLSLKQQHIPKEEMFSWLSEHLRGDNLLVAEYLTAEVLAHLPEPMYIFLLKCSILDRLHPELCQFVSGFAQSENLLLQAASGQLFLQSLDLRGEWYKLHQLFRELLQKHLCRQFDAAQVKQLYRLAADWYERHGDFVAVLRCLVDGNLSGLAAEWVQARSRSTLLQHRLMELHHWFELLPESEFVDRPQLMLDRAWLFSFTASPSLEPALVELENCLQSAPAVPQQWRDELRIQQLLVRYFTPKRDGLYEQTLQVVAACAPESHLAIGWGQTILALVKDGVAVQVSLFHAEQALAAFTEAKMRVSQIFALGIQAVLFRGMGQPQRCMAVCLQALKLLEPERMSSVAENKVIFTLMLGEICYWKNEIGSARHWYEQTLQDAKLHDESPAMLLAMVCLDLCGLADGTLRALPSSAQLEQEEQLWQKSEIFFEAIGTKANIVYWQVLRWLAYNRPEDAWRAYMRLKVEPADLTLAAPDSVWLAYLTATTVCGRNPSESLHWLQQQLERFRSTGFLSVQVYLEILSARHQHRIGNHQRARSFLRQALHGVEQMGYVRMVLDFPELQPVLNVLGTSYSRALLAQLESQADHLRSQLEMTDQERAILVLLVDNLNPAEIADQLTLAPSTVKWYMHKIYTKLQVKNRRQAVAKAVKLGLL
jgi:LuxR family maltose regulon positive regulatory protein